jgi:hypothetical protein
LSRERIVLWGVFALAVLACIFGLAIPPSPGPHGGKGEQALDLIRVLSTVALALALLLGPGTAWRGLSRRDKPLSLGFLPLPGLMLLIAAGGLAWALAGDIEPRLTCFAVLMPVLGGVLGSLLWAGPEEIFEPEEQRCLLVVGCILGLAVARALWSLGPVGELYGGTISRTLEVGDRSDSRISFHIAQLVAHGSTPYGDLATTLLSPYNFSSRGPFSGLGSAPVVLMAGGHPPSAFPEQPWAPFDSQGFMAYRLAMMTFACTAFISLWDLTRRLAGLSAARVALVLAATTPFLVHEVWFTWPKMLAAAMILLAAICVIEKQPLYAGLLAGLGYLVHPGALLSLPVLGLIALWPLRGAQWKRPRLKQVVLLAAGLAVFLISWRVLNGSHYDQGDFVSYFTEAGANSTPDVGTWLTFRLDSLGNTLVPLLLVITSASDASINVLGSISPSVIHFFFQYWNTLPFGIAILFFPLLLVSLWDAGNRWPWPILATVVVPFLLFVVYWGSSSTGMLREGLQTWILTLFVVVACQQAAEGFGWLRSTPLRILLTLRVAEVLAVAVIPTIATGHRLLNETFALTDAAALVAIAGFCAFLGWFVWTMTPTRLPDGDRNHTSLHSRVDA